MAFWTRFETKGKVGFGTVERDRIAVHSGDMFDAPRSTGEVIALADVEVLTPCVPSKMIALWNNYHALANKLDLATPPEPLYFIKSPSSYLATGGTIRRPAGYAEGPVVYEGELGIVIGKRCSNIGEAEAATCIFGYTCINDVTASGILNRDPSFAQWTRAKSFDGFGVFGPVIATGLDPMTLSVRTILNGDERQNYPVSDIVFPPAKLVGLLSCDMTLMPGDVIACGTSVGVGAMKQPENTVTISIKGIGDLTNTFVN